MCAHPGRITLLAVGPLTNVATAFALAPELPALLAGLVIMGGSTIGGNITAAAEFNIHADPEAAARVFDCGVPVQMFGLNVCRQLPIGQPQIDRLKAIGSARLSRRLRGDWPPPRPTGAVALRPDPGDLAGAAQIVRPAGGAR